MISVPDDRRYHMQLHLRFFGGLFQKLDHVRLLIRFNDSGSERVLIVIAADTIVIKQSTGGSPAVPMHARTIGLDYLLVAALQIAQGRGAERSLRRTTYPRLQQYHRHNGESLYMATSTGDITMMLSTHTAQLHQPITNSGEPPNFCRLTANSISAIAPKLCTRSQQRYELTGGQGLCFKTRASTDRCWWMICRPRCCSRARLQRGTIMKHVTTTSHWTLHSRHCCTLAYLTCRPMIEAARRRRDWSPRALSQADDIRAPTVMNHIPCYKYTQHITYRDTGSL